MKNPLLPAVLGAVLGVAACLQCVQAQSEVKESGVLIYDAASGKKVLMEKIKKTDQEWKKQLTEDQYYITRKKKTEAAFTGAYFDLKDKGIYKCICCGTDLFRSEEKYDSKTGWPSFWAPVAEENIHSEEDRTFFMLRTEVMCARCDAHLGHVFTDGPEPTGKRYCINSASLRFVPANNKEGVNPPAAG